jgi:hypothetical protein
MTLKKLAVSVVVLGLVNIAPGMLKQASAAARHPVHLMVLSFNPQKATSEGQNHQGEPRELDKDVAENEVDEKDMENDEKDDVDVQERENDKDNGEEHHMQNRAGHHDDLDNDDKDTDEDRDSDRDDDLQGEQENHDVIPPR